ncbi:MAG: ABC transporter permease [Alphaproteobacteria bacterium HGW-Alphaproteobacteria-6]|nr:MAG: ABC transporter permease [Alphaproteobacteria bacterium HGW-Alphaproteobacteria-6]
MSLYQLFGSLETGFIFGIVALGAYLTFKILDFPDLTVEGSFPLGAAVAATLIVGAGLNPWVATLAGGLAGFCAGFVTAWLNVRFRILHILAGILVAISLYSLNLRIMGGPNKPLLNVETVFTAFEGFGVKSYIINPIVLGVFALAVKLALDLLLATGFGMAMRAAGANPAMAEANGVNVGRMKLIGVGIANFLTAIAGALFAQIFGAADAYMGIGVIIVGLASVIVGMSVLPSRTIMLATAACIGGAILYRLAVAAALNADFIGLQASDVQLVTAVLVAVALIVQQSGGRVLRAAKRGGRGNDPA